MNTSLRFEMPAQLKRIALVLLVVGAIMGGLSFFVYDESPIRVWASLLLNNFYFLALAIFGCFIWVINYIATSGWMIVMKRIYEAMALYLPVGIIGMLLIGFFGMGHIYEWSHQDIVDDDVILQAKDWYLNKTMFYGVTIFILIVWTLLVLWLRRNSINEDANGGTKYYFSSFKISAGFIVVASFSFCAAIFLWLMSIEPHWYSTIYAVYVFASVLVLGFTFLNVSSLYLKGKGLFPWFNDNHMHDNSKFMFGFSIFWAYIFTSQLLLIWYANIPEETPHYLIRWGQLEGEASYMYMYWINFFLNFLTPFLVFMTRNAKRVKQIVLIVCGIMLIAKWMDFYLLIMPGAIKFANHHAHLQGLDTHAHPGFGLPEIGFFLLFAGIFILVVGRALGKANILPKNHPMLGESLTHHV